MTKRLVLLFVLLVFSSSSTGCGLEVLFLGLPTGGEHTAPPPKKETKLTGQAPELPGGAVVARAAGAKIAEGTVADDGSFSLNLPKNTEFSNLTVEVTLNAVLFKAVVPQIKAGKTTDAGTVNVASTAATLILEARLSALGLELINYPAQGMSAALATLQTQLETEAKSKRFKSIVETIYKAVEKRGGSKPVFQVARYQATGDPKEPPTVSQSGLTQDGLGSGLDYCNQGDLPQCQDGPETSTAAFDQALAEAALAFALPSCTYADQIRVVLTVVVDGKAKDGNCKTIKQFKHAKQHGGLACSECKVFFAGGVHPKSGINDPKINQKLGNWEPNKMQMYDDGTHGDLVAGDAIWTITFALPAPKDAGKNCKTTRDCGDEKQTCIKGRCKETLRLGYKYTFGLAGDIWGGTEEFPGNQRLLEIVDQNGDGFVSRHDDFADETSNKDRVNTLQKKGATGMVCFYEPTKEQCTGSVQERHANCGCKIDHDGDGIPDSRERPWDKDQDCTPEGYRVFANVQPLTVKCE